VRLRATGLAPDGCALAAHDGVELAIPDLLPGELAEVEVVHVGPHGRGYGRLVRLLEPHPGRRPPPCRHQGRCSGCALMIATETTQRQLKREQLAERYGLPVGELVTLADRQLGYRWSSKRVVVGRAGSPVLGSYRRRSHRLADMAGCSVDHPALVACAGELRRGAAELWIEPYDERRRRGDLRYCWLRQNGAGQVLLTLVMAHESAGPAAARLAAKLQQPAGIFWCVQPGQGNAMRGAEPQLLKGSATIAVELCGQRVAVGPLGFLQPNPPVAELAYRDLVRRPAGGELPAGRLALDLYAGLGLTTGLLRQRFDRVLPCETYPESAAALAVEPQRVEDLLRELLADPAGRPQIDLVVANPARAGLGEEVCRQLSELAPPALHLMSCAPGALARDLRRLTEAGGFRLAALRAYDTLPQTPHVELIAWLQRRR